MSSETSFVSKQPKLVSALSETRRLFQLFRFNIETGVSVFRNIQNKQKTSRNSSKFVKISTFLIPHTISSVCFGCFNTGLKLRNKPPKKFGGFAKKQTEKHRNKLSFGLFWFEPRKKINGFEDPLIENVFWRFFWFVSRKFCLFRLFRYRSETPKQTKTNRKKVFWFRETNRKSTETD